MVLLENSFHAIINLEISLHAIKKLENLLQVILKCFTRAFTHSTVSNILFKTFNLKRDFGTATCSKIKVGISNFRSHWLNLIKVLNDDKHFILTLKFKQIVGFLGYKYLK